MSGRDITSFVELAAIKRKLLISPRVAERVATRAAAALSEKAREAFDAQRSVYGVPYAAAVDLNETGRLRAQALKYVATGTKIRASVGSVPYARYQLKHGYLPAKGRVPDLFNAEIERIAQDELAREFGGGAGR